MAKKTKNEMPVYGVTCSKCNGSNIVMNTDTKELVCLDCGEGVNPCLILNTVNSDDVKYPTITVTDNSKTIPPVPTTSSDAYKAPTELNIKVSRNEDNINILDENTNRVFDMVTALETKVEELIGNVEDIRNHLRANSTHFTHFQNGLSGCENSVDNIEDKIADMCAELSRHKTTIKDTSDSLNSLYKCYDNLNYEVCQNRKMIQKLGGELNDADHITTFGELKVGDKFKLSNDPVPYIKVRNVGDRYLAYNAVLFLCYAIQDDYPVIPIKAGGRK